jgi:His-Xaa-Ser system radical SAM maturase HxsB
VIAGSKFADAAAYEPTRTDWQLLPFRFERFSADRVLVTNLVGEHVFLTASDFDELVSRRLPANSDLVRRLRGKHLIRPAEDQLPQELLALKTRTRFERLAQFTSLHMFVVSLRCDHSCPYCQVSRQSADRARFDMTPETAEQALDLVFRSPSQQIKIEFQGGEPLLNFPLIRKIVLDAKAVNEHWGRDLSFVVATNLALLDDAVLAFCEEHGIHISTSLDGPRDLHNANRPRPGHDSWELAVRGIRRVQEELGIGRVSALMTTTERSLGRVREIVDTYLGLGLTSIFLRPLSPYGFAIKTKAHASYDVERWLSFYDEGLAYILELNAQGVPMLELYASLALKKMLTNVDPGYVDLASPARIGIGAVVYNYDGDVYASDEGRMLAEMGDTSFRLGNVHRDSYDEIFLADNLLDALERSYTGSAPMCSDCAFEPYCGADPVFHHATGGDPVGHKALSAFCRRNMSVFRRLLTLYEDDPFARQVFHRWVDA